MESRALDITSVFSRALGDYKKNPKFIVPRLLEFAVDIALIAAAVLIIILAALAFLPSLALGDIQALLYEDVPVAMLIILVFGALALLVTVTFISAAARAAIIAMAKEAHGSGSTSLETGLNGVRRFTLGMVLFSLATGLVFLALLALALVPFAFGSVFLGVFALILGGLIYLAFYLFVFFTPVFIVTRGNGVIAGFGESVGFVEKNFAPVIVYGAIVVAVTMGVALVTNILGIGIDRIENPVVSIAFGVLHLLFSVTLSLLMAPYFDIVKTYMVMEV